VKGISRRDFIHAGCTAGGVALISNPARGWNQGTAPPIGKKGHVNLNIFSSEYDFPFINMAPTYSRFFASGSGHPTQDVFPFFNADNYPTGIPKGADHYSAFGSLYYPGGYATFTGTISSETTLTVTSAITGDPLAIGRTVRGTGVLAGTRILSGSGTVWTLSRAATNGSGVSITASIPWVIDWVGNAAVTLGIGGNGLVTSTAVNISANRIEYHLQPYGGAVVIGSLSGSTLSVTSFVSGRAIPARGALGALVLGVGMPPYTCLQDTGGGGGTGNYTLINPSSGAARTLSYTTSAQQYTIGACVFGTTINSTITITSIRTTPSAIRVYRQDQESLLNAGQLCAPHFISYYGQYGRIRFLNWMQTNGNMQAQWIQRPGVTNFSWQQNNLIPPLYGGQATKSKNDYSAPNAISYTDSGGVVQSNPTSWTDGMMLQTSITTVPTMVSITGFSNANPAKVTAPSHGFTTGDVVFFTNGGIVGGSINSNLNSGLSNGLLAKCFYTITVLDANNFTLNGVDSTSWGTYVSGGSVGWQIRFKSGSLPYKQAVAQTYQAFFDGSTPAFVPNVNQSLITLVYSADLDVLALQPPDNLGRGVPIEIACQICNECGADAWISVPILATDNFVTQMATTIKANLNPSQKWCFELANEVWNTAPGFWQSFYAQFVSFAQYPGGFTSNAVQGMYEWYGYRFGQMATLINAVYSASDHSRCVRILGFKTDDGVAAPFANTWRTTAPTINPPSIPASFANEFCCATYLGNTAPGGGSGDFASPSDSAKAIGNYQQGILTSNPSLVTSALNAVDTAFNSYTSNATAYYTAYRRLAATYGVQLSAYEGGFSVVPSLWYGGSGKPISPMSYLGIPFNNLDQLNLWTAYQTSSQYGVSYTAFLNLWKSLGGTYSAQYQSTGLTPDPGSMSAMRYNIFGPTNPGEVSFNAYNAS
jgi:hypothetical protein